ncbi:PP2C family protein-serine/threonine phosphatase [Nocardioides bruguierae]|uniref:Protein phosphatase 2C domain-containing protein n=1 Tax=Nocardioides bruguierae TaxID=2945102 RepID=A0A9X2IFE9_9ACTN|nr:protein phosphatase 2C domain-containing protein [Nocardioides bruguierae]MCL8026742.1 protein phosphatase 2C domain-containing protein [Nocardioides bruguierae]MCM0621008.1 protein phosphatase 2C domain-containing protein [Nocardioides bruguierae]
MSDAPTGSDAHTPGDAGGRTDLRLHWSAISDVGRVRKDNQDSGYAGPHLLTVCDGVGGAARGDIASSTAVSQLRRLDSDTPPDVGGQQLLTRTAAGIQQAAARIGRAVDDDPEISGTSTTATVLHVSGNLAAVGHVGDSRAYLLREGRLSQITQDHTFVQTLIDEGRITEDEARVHPHRNVILRALDGVHEAEPDLFLVELEPGDRLLVCSDGASGYLEDSRLADILRTGTPDFAAVELVRASLEAGSSDNVTCVVADVLTPEQAAERPELDDLMPMLVGAASELRRRSTRGGLAGGLGTGLFRGHRSGDTGEIEPIDAPLPDLPADVHAYRTDPLDAEAARYAPRPPRRLGWLRRILAALVLVGVVWVGVAALYSWSQEQYYVGQDDGVVVIYQGINASLPGIALSQPYEETNVEVDRLSDFNAERVRGGLSADDLTDARTIVENLAETMGPGAPAEDAS